MPSEWRSSTTTLLYKNKGDIYNCNNYRGIKLLSHIMTQWERLIKRRLRKDISLSKNKFGFIPGRLTIEAIHLLRKLMELYRNRKINLYMVFINLEKANDRLL